MEQIHIPVMLHECIEGLAIKPNGIYVDGTLGRAGHSTEILKRLNADGRLVGIDRDAAAIEESKVKLLEFGEKAILVKGNFRELGSILDSQKIDKVDGMLFDLGVSSPQLDDAKRGFSYMNDAPLDMRMDRAQTLTAYEILNSWSEAEIKKILFEYGEERFAPKIASAVIKSREIKPIETTLEFVEIIKSAMPAAAKREKQHPAKRSFQAIRIAVNDELSAVSDMLETAVDRLRPGGRLAVISFHSLEDRIVKNVIRANENGCTCPKDFPVCVCGFKQKLKSITKKPILASERELELNSR